MMMKPSPQPPIATPAAATLAPTVAAASSLLAAAGGVPAASSTPRRGAATARAGHPTAHAVTAASIAQPPAAAAAAAEQVPTSAQLTLAAELWMQAHPAPSFEVPPPPEEAHNAEQDCALVCQDLEKDMKKYRNALLAHLNSNLIGGRYSLSLPIVTTALRQVTHEYEQARSDCIALFDLSQSPPPMQQSPPPRQEVKSEEPVRVPSSQMMMVPFAGGPPPLQQHPQQYSHQVTTLASPTRMESPEADFRGYSDRRTLVVNQTFHGGGQTGPAGGRRPRTLKDALKTMLAEAGSSPLLINNLSGHVRISHPSSRLRCAVSS